jgi:integrase
LTIENIKKFDRHLYSTGKKSTTIYNYHKNLKTYINIAIKEGLFLRDQNPYEIFETKKGRFALRVRLDDNEMLAIETTVITHPDIDMVRNIFIFCMYTGIAYGDCQKLTSQNLKFIESQYWIEGLRKKSGEFYSVPLLDQPLSIVEMYKGKEFLFPRLSHYQYNRRLKTLANLCEINKNITSHTARHTCATFLLRKGVSLKVISEILGHSLLRTTEVYAKLEKERMKEEFDVLREKLKKTGGCNRKHLIK